MDWSRYPDAGFYDEIVSAGSPRPELAGFGRFLSEVSIEDLLDRQEAAELAMRAMGITFTVYAEQANIDRAWPFDVLPRVIAHDEWRRTEAGLIQRLMALNHFIDDLYGEQKIMSDGVVPAELITGSPNYRPECVGVSPPFGVWAHISGSDLVRDADGTIYVLEDNLRVPSGVSYMLENRLISKRVFAELFRDLDIQPVDGYPDAPARGAVLALAPARASGRPSPCSPPASSTRPTSSTPSWPSRWASSWSRAATSSSRTTCVYVRTIDGPSRVDVIYRRIDDLFLDPEVFRPDSVLGVPGLMRAWRAGNVGIANAPGAGVADDKVVYAYVPDMIRYYLGEEPRIPNVPTLLCRDDTVRRYVLDHLEELVVKPANESGGYGIFIGSQASADERDEAGAASRPTPQLDRPTDPGAVDRADAVRRRPRAPPRRPAPVHPHG